MSTRGRRGVYWGTEVFATSHPSRHTWGEGGNLGREIERSMLAQKQAWQNIVGIVESGILATPHRDVSMQAVK